MEAKTTEQWSQDAVKHLREIFDETIQTGIRDKIIPDLSDESIIEAFRDEWTWYMQGRKDAFDKLEQPPPEPLTAVAWQIIEEACKPHGGFVNVLNHCGGTLVSQIWIKSMEQYASICNKANIDRGRFEGEWDKWVTDNDGEGPREYTDEIFNWFKSHLQTTNQIEWPDQKQIYQMAHDYCDSRGYKDDLDLRDCVFTGYIRASEELKSRIEKK